MDGAALIVGCGYVGTEFALEWSRSGGTAYGLRRRVATLPDGITRVPADLGDPGPLPEVPELDLIVYCPSAGARTAAAYRAAYVDGVTNIRAALGARVSPRTRGIYVSSTAAFGEIEGDVDERTPPQPTAETAKLLLEGERAFAATFPTGSVLRLAGIYGPTRTRLARSVLEGGPFESSAETIGNRIHLRDCAGALLHVAARKDPASLYVGVDSAAVPLGEVRAFVATQLGLDPSPFTPRGPARGKRLRASQLLREGYEFRVPSYREGYPAIVAELARN